MSFSIRTLLVVTTFCAIAAWIWPRTGMMIIHVMSAMFALSFVLSYILSVSAWNILQDRVASSASDRTALPHEKIAFASGLVGMIPYTALGIMFVCDQFESTHRAVGDVMRVMLYVALAL